jgi:hypothetical protein
MKLTKEQRRIRRAANRLISKRRYRESHGGVKEPVWTIRRGPTNTIPKKLDIPFEEIKSQVLRPTKKETKNILKRVRDAAK